MKPSLETANANGVGISEWLADQNLYIVTGLWGCHDKACLYVIATDAGDAERKATEAWKKLKYNHKPTNVSLVGSGKHYGKPECCTTLVG